ncbi:MAG: iron ABC transporter permease [Clostridia bacterium]|nr:iron ABC transporter permease [Clostridia bacterium]
MSRGFKIGISIAAGTLCLLLGMGVGSVSISPGDMIAIVRSQLGGAALPERIPAITASILWSLRMPRAIMAFLVGASLAASGAAMQSVLRNPLASSYTLGVSSGASLAAAAVILSGFTLPFFQGYTLALAGFAGGLATVFLAMGLAGRFDRNLENTTVILIGMVLSLFVNAILTLLTAFSGEHLQQLIFWQMGSFAGLGWTNCGLVAAIALLGTLALTRFGRELDLMTFGEEQALSAGVELRRVKLAVIALCALLTGSAVAFAGVIGFIDLIAPHVVRRLFGSNHRLVIPMSALFGGSFMVVADLVSRTIVSPAEMPVGAVTALVGAPFFAWVYFRRRRGERRA